jgi:hypothetical protein
LATELISCCGMFGIGAGTGAGSAWAVPTRPPTISAADEPATTAVARK